MKIIEDIGTNNSEKMLDGKRDEDTTEGTPVQTFYHESTVLITGGTGFVGKVLLEKLLRVFQLKRVYLLIRVKDNLSVNQRLENLFKDTIFDKIREDYPQCLDKVHPIYADFNANDLDISPADKMSLCNEVQIVFNVVASVKFNEKLHDAIDINVIGTKKILNLVMEIKNLKSFVHISTLYSNCNRKSISERVYGTEIPYEKIIQLNRILEEYELEKLQHCLLGEMPNTYTMTKKCAENLVNHKAFYLPAGIFRLPIVISTYKEPFPGWTDNLYGPSGLCTWSARGFVRCIYGNSRLKANLIPADYCANALITSAWDIWKRYKGRVHSQIEIPVYNYYFSTNNLTWGKYMQLARMGFHEPFEKALWYFSYVIVPWRCLHQTVSVLLHDIPGYILDLIALATGQKRIYTKSYQKISKVIHMMSYFGLREWNFANENINKLDRQLGPSERKYLEFNIATINWNQYFSTYLSGIRKYIFKENEHNLQKCKIFYRRLYVLHLLIKSTFGIFAFFTSLRILLKIISSMTKYFL